MVPISGHVQSVRPVVAEPRPKPQLASLQEKRKRDLGMQKGGKGNYVEEEKRIARQHGVYGAGFD